MGRTDLCNSWIGTTFAAKHWLALDPCGLLCVTFSFSFHVYALVVIYQLLLSTTFAAVVYTVFYIPSSTLALLSLYQAWTTNPGAVPMGAKPLTILKRQASSNVQEDELVQNTRGERRCHKCMDNFKPPRAHHDSVTGRCIVKFDHYCPWVGNAIGALNHKFFVLFIGYTCLTSGWSLLLLLTKFINCSSVPSSSDEESDEEKSADVANRFLEDTVDACTTFQDGRVFVLVLLCMSVVFMIFTCCMLCEQMDAVMENTSKIARMKQRVGKAGTELSRVTTQFNEMFGGNGPHPTWHWFLPTRVRFHPSNMESVILGFVQEEVCEEHDEENPPASNQEDNQDDDASQHSSLLAPSPRNHELETELSETSSTKNTNDKTCKLKRRDTNPKFVDSTKEFT